MTPLISVLLPVYNAERYLRTAVGSILTQSERDFELVIINDGSSDGSGDLLEALATTDDRIRVVHVSNGGVVKALNLGLGLCRGEFIARMDADDISTTSRFDTQRAYLQAHPKCVALGSAVTIISQDGVPVRVASYPTGPSNVARSMLSGCAMAHPTVMMRRQAIEAVGGYRGALAHAEDYDLWLRMMQYGELDNIPLPLLQYRQHSGQVSTRFSIEQAISTALALELFRLRDSGLAEPDLTSVRPLSLKEIRALPLTAAARARICLSGLSPSSTQSSRELLQDTLKWVGQNAPEAFGEARSAKSLWHLAWALLRKRDWSAAALVAAGGLANGRFSFVRAAVSIAMDRLNASRSE